MIKYTYDQVNKMLESYKNTTDTPYLLVNILRELELQNVNNFNFLTAAKISEEMYQISHKFDPVIAIYAIVEAYVFYSG